MGRAAKAEAEAAALVLVTVAVVVFTAAAQSTGDIPKCATEVAPCFGFLNSTKTPPSSCCEPLKEAVTNEQKCLCSFYHNPTLIQAFNVNVTQALNLISLCHLHSVKDPQNFCKALAPSPSASASPSSSGSTPKHSGSASTSSPANAAAKVTGVGLAFILLMFGAYSMFC